MHWILPGSDWMRTGRALKIGLTGEWHVLVAKSNRGSAHPCNSDSIEVDFCKPSVPRVEGLPRTYSAGPIGATIPCLRTPYSTQSFSFWNQPVAAVSEDCLRQLKMRSAFPEGPGSKMTAWSHLSASHLNSVLPGSLQTENAVSEANPEV